MRIFGFDIKRAQKVTGGHPSTLAYWLQKAFYGGSLATASGKEVTPNDALGYSPYWAAVNLISSVVGFLPFITYKEIEEGKERAPKHPVFRLLKTQPNRFMDAGTFRETLTGHVLSWGNGYAEIERNGAGKPIALWPLLPNRVVPEVITPALAGKVGVQLKENTLFYRVNTSLDGIGSMEDGKTVYLRHDDVYHIKGMGFDGLKGYSVVHYMAETLGSGIAARDNGATFLKNDSTPTGILTHTDTLTPETKKSLRKGWEDAQGLGEKYRIAIIDMGLKYETVGISPEDAQLLQTRKFEIAEIARWFGIPPHMLGDLEKSSFNNIEQQSINFVVYTMHRWLKKWENEAEIKLFGATEPYFARFIVDALLRGDIKTRTLSYKTGINFGYFTRNEVRRKEDLNNLPGLDKPLVPLNMQTVDEKGNIEPQAEQLGSTAASGGEKNSMNLLLEQTWGRIVTKEVKAVRKALKKPDTFDDFIIDFYKRHTEHITGCIEPVLRVNNDVEGHAEKLAKNIANIHTTEALLTLQDVSRNGKVINHILDTWEKWMPQARAVQVYIGDLENE